MSIIAEIALEAFVLLRLGERRFALGAGQIVELIAPSRVFRFPHRTTALEGVLLRRGKIVPVCDVSEHLVGKKLATRRFYLIATRFFGGDCELITAEMTPRSESDSAHVAGWLSHGGDVIEILNLEALTPGPNAAPAHTAALQHPAEVRA
jgi:CheW-like domain